MRRWDPEEWQRRAREHHERHHDWRRQRWERYRHAMDPALWHVRRSLRRRVFWLLAITIAMTGFLVSCVFHFAGSGGTFGYKREIDEVKVLVGHELADVWAAPKDRDAKLTRFATDLDVDLSVKDAAGTSLGAFGAGACKKPQVTIPVTKDGALLGTVDACFDRGHGRHAGAVLWPLLIFGSVLWMASGRLARRLARPYSELARVAKEIGAGKLSARYTIGRHGMDEARILADAINDMAARIEKQMGDQRELLAAVSHEIRTPLARIRLIAELLRGEAAAPGEAGLSAFTAKALDDLDREVVEIDALVSELLASSRVDFAALRAHTLDAGDVAARALERAGLSATLLDVRTKNRRLSADATLLARALANLLGNAEAHGGGVKGLIVRDAEGGVAFEVNDAGPGFVPGDEAKVFESFYRPKNGAQAPTEKGSLGLGLTLVKRIAVAHGGTAFAENREEGGARVGIVIPRGNAD